VSSAAATSNPRNYRMMMFPNSI